MQQTPVHLKGHIGDSSNVGVFNLDSEGISQLTYPNQEGQFFVPGFQQSIKGPQGGNKMTSPMRGAEMYDGVAFQNKVNYMNASSHSYNPQSYDPVRILHLLNCLEPISATVLLIAESI